jgi:hypothetical protein
MKFLIKRLFLGRASQKKIAIHFIVNIGFSKAYYSKDIHVNVLKLYILTNFEASSFPGPLGRTRPP